MIIRLLLSNIQPLKAPKLTYNTFSSQSQPSMRLMINYKGINKQMLNAENYEDIVKFVHENFFLKMSKWSMSYVDADGDIISLDSDVDVNMMRETLSQEQIKIQIKDIVTAEGISHVGQEIDISNAEVTSSKVKTQNVPIAEVQHTKTEAKVQEPKPKEEEPASKGKQMGPEMGDKCFGGRGGMWKKKIEEKMAKFVDQRVENLLPYIIKKVEEKLQNKQVSEPTEIKTQQINHKVKCNLCGTDPILGIRYKCTKCPLFNLCQDCEAKNSHHHNLIKMRFIEEEEKVQEAFGHPWWKRGHGFMPPPPPMMGPGQFSFPPPPPFSFPGNCGFKCPPPPFPQIGMPINQPIQPSQCHYSNKDKSASCDPRFKITKKCFKMSQLFGGEAHKYQQFVMKNLDLKMDELSQLYITMNQSVEMSELAVDKIEEKIKKLGFYFNRPEKEFKALVEKNPAANFRQLVALAKKQPIPQPKKQQKPVMQSKQLPIPPKTETIPVNLKPLMQKKQSEIKKASQNIQKRNECVLEMKQLLGDENVFEYISFYNQFSELENQKIIQLYLEKLTGGK